MPCHNSGGYTGRTGRTKQLYLKQRAKYPKEEDSVIVEPPHVDRCRRCQDEVSAEHPAVEMIGLLFHDDCLSCGKCEQLLSITDRSVIKHELPHHPSCAIDSCGGCGKDVDP